MKHLILSLAFLINVFLCYSQTSTGLIAHWDMNGTTNDVSGNGHNGHGNNLTSAIGKDGVMGHAWYFNGTNSWITIPCSPALNIQAFTISATLKVEGFYTGTCHGNIILARGTTAPAGTGTYLFEFTDYPAGYGCTTGMDTTRESFMPKANGTGTSLLSSTYTPFDYTPHIVANQWYNVVVTFNDTVYKTWVNNVLKATDTIATPGVHIGTSTDSASIGYNIYEATSGYPYGFKGILDDIRFYNRVLSDTEILHLFPTGIENTVAVNSTISIYPNPATTEISISASNLINQITITNLFGKTVYTHEYNSEHVQVNIADLPAGMYFIKINGAEVRKFVKQ